MSEKTKKIGRIASKLIYQEFLQWGTIGDFFDNLPDETQMEVRKMIQEKTVEAITKYN